MQSANQQLYTVLLIVFVGFIGISVAYPLLPPLFLNPEFGLTPTLSPASRSILLGLTLAAYPFGQFVGSPFMGALSDRYGRRKILLISLAATSMGFFLSALALTFNQLWLLILSRLITGLAESNLALAQSIVADLKEINKHRGFGGVNMAASIGYVIGPLLAGFLSDQSMISWFNTAMPFYAAMLLSVIALGFAYLKLPETHLAPSTVTQKIWQYFNLFAHLRELAQNRLLKFLLITSLLFCLGIDIFYEFGPVFLVGHFEMNPGQISIYNGVLAFMIGVSGMWLPQRLVKTFSPHRIVIIFAFIFIVLLTTMITTASEAFLLLLFALSGLIIPVTQTVINVQLSDVAGSEIQGKVMGMQWGLRMFGDSILCLFGGLIIIYSVTLPFVLSICAVVLTISFYYFYIIKRGNGDA